MKDGVGERFQEQTKYDPDRMRDVGEIVPVRAEPFKNYECPLKVVSIPAPDLSEQTGLWDLLSTRRSRRTFLPEANLSMENLSRLLWAAQGTTQRYGETIFRTAPSAGALYPVETYISVRSVSGLDPGIYHFRPRAFDLEYLRDRDHSLDLARAALGQAMVAHAQLTFIWTAVVGRNLWKYRQRTYRYIYLDAGHIGQNVSLAAEAEGLGCCMIGAFFDDHINAMLGVDGTEETVIYLAAVGVPVHR